MKRFQGLSRKMKYLLRETRTYQNLQGENPKSSKISRNKTEYYRTSQVNSIAEMCSCSGDYFFFAVCVKHFSGFIEAFDSKGILCAF